MEKKHLTPNSPITCEILKIVQGYTPVNDSCPLCLEEKAAIGRHAFDPKCLNKRSELGNACRHKAKFKLTKIPNNT